MTSKAEFLSNLPLFRNLDQAAIEALARIAIEFEFDEGATIAYQRDAANSLYIVKAGRLFARALDNQGIARETRAYDEGAYFGDLWLFAPGIHPLTVKGSEPGRVIIIEGPAFLQMLEENRRIITDLAPGMDDEGLAVGLSPAAWEEARKLLVHTTRSGPDVGLLPEDLLEYYARRSVWFLLIREIVPLLLVLLAPILFLLLPDGIGLVNIVRYGLPIIALALGLFLLIWRWLDWRNDYFAITSSHLMHREFDLRTFRIDMVKVPISQIQSVQVSKPSWLANFFNIGDAQITTAAAAGVVVFDNIDNPAAVKDTLNRLTARVRSIDAAQAQAAMRRSIEQHFEMDPSLRSVDGQGQSRASRPRPSGLGAWFRHTFGSRVEVNGVITYRKSFIALLKETAIPLLAILGAFLLIFLLYRLGVSLAINAVVSGIAMLAAFGFFVWQLENWRNDIFQLTERHVIDIDRLPFGFSEKRKQAAISNIQNVSAERPGFFATIFNYGRVVVDTAGAKADIVFEDVTDPARIQSDIFQRLDDFRRQQRIREGSERRREYAVLLDVYRQVMEEDRMPRRIPDSENEED